MTDATFAALYFAAGFVGGLLAASVFVLSTFPIERKLIPLKPGDSTNDRLRRLQ